MPPARSVVASDSHLGAAPAEAARRFRDFLSRVPELGDDLVLAGDLFDFWFEYRSVVLSEHFDTLRLLAEVVEAGVRVRMVGGNHDAWGGAFLEDQVGLELLDGPAVVEVGGRRTYLAHGDGLAGGDWGYRLLKAVTRSRPARALFRLVHPDLAAAVVRRVSHTGEGEPGDKEERAEVLSDHAARLLREDPELELVIFGHSHRPEVREVEPGRHYLNPGDWLRHFTYGVVDTEGVELRSWPPG